MTQRNSFGVIGDVVAFFGGAFVLVAITAGIFWGSTLWSPLRYLGYILFAWVGLVGVFFSIGFVIHVVHCIFSHKQSQQANGNEPVLLKLTMCGLCAALFLGYSGAGTCVFWNYTFQSKANSKSDTSNIKVEYEPIKNEIDKKCKVSLLEFTEGSTDSKPGILLMVTNNSPHEVMELSLGYSLYANGNCVYSTGGFNIMGMGHVFNIFDPVWKCQIPSGQSKTLIDTIERNSDDHFRLKTAGKLELRLTSIDVRIARVNGKTINFDKWEVLDADDNGSNQDEQGKPGTDSQRILGKWKLKDNLKWEFLSDGTLREEGPLNTKQGTYQLLPDRRMKVSKEGFLWDKIEGIVSYEFSGDELVLTANGEQGISVSVRLRKIN